MKARLTTLAVIELGTGLGMLAIPSFVGEALLGSPFGTAIEPVIARVAGIALLALAVACWLLRNEGGIAPREGWSAPCCCITAAAPASWCTQAPAWGFNGTGFWPAVLAHAVMAVWCLIALLHKSTLTQVNDLWDQLQDFEKVNGTTYI